MNQLARWMLRCTAISTLGAATACGGEPGEGLDEESAGEALAEGLEEEATSAEAGDDAEAAAACRPDLIIQPFNDPCVQRKVWWRVLNVGCAAAPASTATIRFDSAPPKSYAIPALGVSQGSATFETKFALPSDLEVSIRITADANKDVPESNENNNTLFDHCSYE
jgi:hypothetical protein